MRLPSLKHLRTFQIAGRHLSFSQAAHELSITPSAVSHQIRNLEHHLGVPLFLRHTRSLSLTDAGRNYFEFLDEMFGRLEIETQQIWTQFGRRIVRLCVPPFFASEALLPRLTSFQASAPDTDLRVSTQPSAMKVHPAEADLSVLLGTGNWPDLILYPLMARHLVAACAPSMQEQNAPGSLAALSGQTLIVHESRPDAWEQWANKLGIAVPKPRKLLRFDSMTAVVRAAEQGLGIALVSWPLSRAWFDSGALVQLFDEAWETGESFYLAHRQEEANRSEVRDLIDWLIGEFRDDA